MSDFVAHKQRMNKSVTFVVTQARFFTEWLFTTDLEHEIEFKTGKHKQMLPRLQAIVGRSTKMKISFSLSCFLFGVSNYSYNRGWGLFYPEIQNPLFFNQNLYR